MSRRHYEVLEVEALIPKLEVTFTSILQLRAGMRSYQKKLESAGIEIEVGETAAEPEAEDDGAEPAEIKMARALFRGFYDALSDSLEQIRALGGDVKDLDIGLVDFPGKREGQDILICWRLGEKKIQYWHTLDEGFAGRRPIDADMVAAPPRLE